MLESLQYVNTCLTEIERYKNIISECYLKFITILLVVLVLTYVLYQFKFTRRILEIYMLSLISMIAVSFVVLCNSPFYLIEGPADVLRDSLTTNQEVHNTSVNHIDKYVAVNPGFLIQYVVDKGDFIEPINNVKLELDNKNPELSYNIHTISMSDEGKEALDSIESACDELSLIDKFVLRMFSEYSNEIYMSDVNRLKESLENTSVEVISVDYTTLPDTIEYRVVKKLIPVRSIPYTDINNISVKLKNGKTFLLNLDEVNTSLVLDSEDYIIAEYVNPSKKPIEDRGFIKEGDYYYTLDKVTVHTTA